MRKIQPVLIALALLVCIDPSAAQDPVQADTVKTAPGLAKGLGIYVFPSNNQDQKTQDTDEMAYYRWAVEQTGVDPLNPVKVEPGQGNRAPDGTAVAGAARGAAAGAAIGAIAGDAGKGAAIGAVTGAMQGRRAKVVGDHARQQQMNQAAVAREKAMMESFQKAFTACIEGKGYTVR